MPPVIRRNKRNQLLVVTATICLGFLLYNLYSYSQNESWTQIKELFKDSDFNEYKQLSDDGEAPKKLNLNELFVPSTSDSDSDPNSDSRNGNKIRFTPKYERANATFYSIIKSSEVTDLLNTIHSIEERFNHKYHYDWIFISNRNLNGVSKTMLSNSVSGNAIFYQVPRELWSMPPGVDRLRLLSLRRRSRMRGIRVGAADLMRYKLRFQLGFMADTPAFSSYKFALFVEPNMEVKCDILEDFFAVMQSQHKTLGIVDLRKDSPSAVETLWSSAMEFIEQKEIKVADKSLQKIFTEPDGTYNSCYMAHRLQVIDLDLLRSEKYQELFKFLDEKKGWFYERWTESHMYSLLAMVFLRLQDIAFFNIPLKAFDKQLCFVSPQSYFQSNCYCDPAKDEFLDEEKSCMLKVIEVLTEDPVLQALESERQTRLSISSDMQMQDIDSDVFNEEGSLYHKGEDLRLEQQLENEDEHEGEPDGEHGAEHDVEESEQ